MNTTTESEENAGTTEARQANGKRTPISRTPSGPKSRQSQLDLIYWPGIPRLEGEGNLVQRERT